MTHQPAPGRARRGGLALVALALLSACAPAAGPESHPTLQAPAAAEWLAIDSVLRASFPADQPGAVAIVVRDGEVLYRGASGMANLELGVPLHPEMVFQIASMTKQFTGVAILMLAEEGRLALSDPVTRFLPDFPVQGRTVTVEQLLGHTSGIPSFTSMPEWFANRRNDITTGQLLALIGGRPFQFEPGERFEYNNSGYALLGAIIEQVSGMSYGEFVRTRILEPLGMSSSSLSLAAALIPRRASGYSQTSNGAWMNADRMSLSQGPAAGAMLSSADDLARWDAAITRGELLSADSWRRAFTPITLNDGTSSRYGAGWFLGRLGHLATIEHGGDMPGFSLSGVRVPEERLYVAVLTNALPPGGRATPIALELARLALDIPAGPAEVPLAAARLDDYVGTFRHGPNDVRTVSRQGARLTSQRGSGAVMAMLPVGEDLFELEGTSGTQLRFIREAGRIVEVELVPRIGMVSRARRVE